MIVIKKLNEIFNVVNRKKSSTISSVLKSGFLILIIVMLFCVLTGTVIALPTDSSFPPKGGYLKGTYVLKENVESTTVLMVNDGKVTIDLNGFQLTADVTVKKSGNLILIDSGYNGFLSGSINVEGGALTMNAGRITNGGVKLQDGVFTMNSGSIDNCNDGGVFVGSNSVFNMNGGNIVYNTANRGGGVCVFINSIFNMNGGIISANTATTNGGGVYVYDSGRFNVRGESTVIDNTVGDVNNNVYLSDSKSLGLAGDLTQPIGISNPVESGKQFGVLTGGKFSGAENFKNDYDKNIVAYNDNGLLKWSVSQTPKPTETVTTVDVENTPVSTTEPTSVPTQNQPTPQVSSPFPLFGLIAGLMVLLSMRRK